MIIAIYLLIDFMLCIVVSILIVDYYTTTKISKVGYDAFTILNKPNLDLVLSLLLMVQIIIAAILYDPGIY